MAQRRVARQVGDVARRDEQESEARTRFYFSRECRASVARVSREASMVGNDLQQAAERAATFSGLQIGKIAVRAGENRTGFYRRVYAAFETLALLSEHERDAACGYAMAAVMFGIDQRDRKLKRKAE